MVRPFLLTDDGRDLKLVKILPSGRRSHWHFGKCSCAPRQIDLILPAIYTSF